MVPQPYVISSANNMTQFRVYAYSWIRHKDMEIARFDTIEEAVQFTHDVWKK